MRGFKRLFINTLTSVLSISDSANKKPFYHIVGCGELFPTRIYRGLGVKDGQFCLIQFQLSEQFDEWERANRFIWEYSCTVNSNCLKELRRLCDEKIIAR